MTGAAEPRAGQARFHREEGRCAVIAVASHSGTGGRLVIHRPFAGGAAAARPPAMRHGAVGIRARSALEAGTA